ncbi:hypothetical protein PAQ31011_05205 [Pandoraea aquatica]|uniref:DUF4410 domain-containing protein n=2 Tax=Pandoraea aquatica TaxID=2508290 RepID=A0A5E4Z864_9BURK|nr:hypothetical protein PAQ31011_05205 [Pandoraea aquatica]
MLVLALTGCASTSSTLDTSHGVDPALAATLKQGIALPTMDLNGHEVSADVKSEILDAFKLQVEKNGMAISPSGVPVKITVEEYSARSTAARLVFGYLSGSDHIKARVDVSGKTYSVEDTARTSINGIGLIAENVGSEAANGLARLAEVQVNTIQIQRVQPPPGMTTR